MIDCYAIVRVRAFEFKFFSRSIGQTACHIHTFVCVCVCLAEAMRA